MSNATAVPVIIENTITYWPAVCGNGTERDAFWDTALSINTQTPDFTDCFQSTVLVWVPCGIFLLLAPFLFGDLSKLPSTTTKYSKLNTTKFILALGLVVVTLLDFLKSFGELAVDRAPTLALFIKPAVYCISMIVSTVLIRYEFRKSVASGGLLFCFWFMLAILGIVPFRSLIINYDPETEPFIDYVFRFSTFFVYYCLVLLLLILSLWADTEALVVLKTGEKRPLLAEQEDKEDKDDKTQAKPCPELTAPFWQRVLFLWITKMIFYGYRNALQFADLWTLMPGDRCDSVMPTYEQEWDKEVKKHNFQMINKSSDKKSELQTSGVFESSPEKDVPPQKEGSRGRPKNEKGPSFWNVIVHSAGGYFMIGGLYKLVYDVISFINPQILDLLITFIATRSIFAWQGYMYAVLLFAVAMLRTVFLQMYWHICFVVGMRLRTAVTGIVYRKAMRLSTAARKGATVGEIVNLMSVDAQKLQEAPGFLHMLWSAPLTIALAMYFLWQQLGPSTLAGLGLMILLVPINAVIAQKTRKLQIKQMKFKDNRLKLMNEVLNGIKVLKLYAWEDSFRQRVLDIRDDELKVLRTAAYLSAGSSLSWMMAPYLVALTTFAVYSMVSKENILDANKTFVSLSLFNLLQVPASVLPAVIATFVQVANLKFQVALGSFTVFVLSSPENVLDANRAFVSLSLFNLMNYPMSILPAVIAYGVQAAVSIGRITNFLKKEEVDEENVGNNPQDGCDISVTDGTMSWGPDEAPVLRDINLKVEPGKLVGVVGTVGAGKSSLISALLGEMQVLQGRVDVRGSVAYVPQQAWIQNATLRDNVFFGEPVSESKYQKVIEACALGPDLKILPGGDYTEIGEKGINLSGGQKQRVSLARAVYQNNDIYLLDDPLSAVDSHVGKHIFQQVIGPHGMLKNKTRILVTNSISYLNQMDVIVTLRNGEVSEVGTYEELLSHKGAFADFITTYLKEVDEADEDEDALEIRSQLLRTISTMSGPEDDPAMDRASGSAKLSRQRSQARSARSARSGRSGSKVTDVMSKDEIQIQAKLKQQQKLIDEELAMTGSVKFSVFRGYMRTFGKWQLIITLSWYVVFLAAQCFTNIWLSWWSTDPAPVNGTVNTGLRDLRLGVYGGLGAVQALCTIGQAFGIALGCISASGILHTELMRNIMRAPMSFFDTTPLGRIVNRFSRDVDVLDINIPLTIRIWLATFAVVITTIFVICYSTPIFIAVFLPLMVFYYFVQRFYINTSRQLKRIDSIRRSPIYAHFSESITGVSSIRAYAQVDRFVKLSDKLIDENQMAYYPNIVSNRWLGIWLEFIGNLVVLFASIFAVAQKDTIDAGLAGLSVSYALQVTGALNMMVRMSSDMENYVVAVERIQEYTECPKEAPPVIQGNRPRRDWPNNGLVEFKDYSTRYRPGLDLVLKDIMCTVNPGEKVGIVGRTGAGKSSLTLALFRIIESASGSITIDGQNISSIGLTDLRSKLTIIPQDPVLFSGNMRMNLDPFERHSDGEVWRALEQAHLKDYVLSLPDQLEHMCTEGGDNLSLGQRQLVCLARALLRRTKVLVLDEATAAVDLETDDLIQTTIRTEFNDSTIITIAHRINTIMDYNRVMVLDQGRIAEFDTLSTLLENKDGMFYSMAKDAGLISTQGDVIKD